MNSTQRAHIIIPSDLLREIDAIVGPRGRTAFLLETAREEVRRRKLLNFLESKEPGSEEAYREDAAAWVRKLRSASEGRIDRKRPPSLQRKRK
jgi:hypothetical protein